MYLYTGKIATRKLSIPSLYYVFYHCKVTQYIVLDRIKDIPYITIVSSTQEYYLAAKIYCL